MRTILQTGNRRTGESRRDNAGRRGFTFVEVMVAVAILSLGLVLVSRVLLTSISNARHLRVRMAAFRLLNNRMADFQRQFQLREEIPLGAEQSEESALISHHPVLFRYDFHFLSMPDPQPGYKLVGTVKWKEGQRDYRFTREMFLTGITPKKEL